MNAFHAYSDKALLDMVRQSSEAAFTEIYDRYWARMYAVALYHFQSKETAEDVLHDIFFSLWKRRQSLEIESLAGYLATAVKHRVFSELRRLQKNGNPVAIVEMGEENLSEFRLLLQEAQREIDRLPEKTRIIFRSSRFAGRRNKEIAAAMGISEKAVEKHIHKALKTLRTQLRSFLFYFF